MAGAPIASGPDVVVPDDPQSIAFVNGLVERGEAAAPAADGSLQAGVTHAIVGRTAAGHPIVKRLRFSAF